MAGARNGPAPEIVQVGRREFNTPFLSPAPPQSADRSQSLCDFDDRSPSTCRSSPSWAIHLTETTLTLTRTEAVFMPLSRF